MQKYIVVVLFVVLAGCGPDEVASVVEDEAMRHLNAEAVQYVERAHDIERRACSCRDGRDCFKQFIADINAFKQDAGDKKVPRTAAIKIKRYTENAMKCALVRVRKED